MNKERSNAQYDGKIAGLYDLGESLGRGHFAVVKLARHVFTGEQVAVKVIDKSKLDDISRAHLFQEVRCMKLVQHPNVVRLYEVIDTHTKLYLILEYGDGGDMYDYIMKHEKGVSEEFAKKYFKQIVQAISYCHKLHVVHRDLKPENVVFFEKIGVVKLTDFGFSNKFCPGQKLETSCGSLAYSAPEILLGDSYDAPKVDVWSLGVILYMMVCGHAPFQEANDSETLTMIMDCKYTIPSYVSPECKELIGRMLIRDPEKRATLEQIAEDIWLQGAGPGVADFMPLISREHLSEEDHAHIVNKMVNGSIASKEQILEELDKNEYNHITATYFLLAERKLRALRQEKAQQLNHHRISRPDLSPVALTPGVSSAAPSPAQEKPPDSLLSPLFPCPPRPSEAPGSLLLAPSLPPALPLGRKCSIVREEDDSPASSPSKSPVALRPPAELFAEAADKQARTVLTLPVPRTPGNSAGSSPKCKAIGHSNRRLHSVHSSPQLPLNEINEEASNGHAMARTDTSPTHKEQQASDGSFVNQNYLVDSTDSLDFLSDGQPRLVNSMSCGDLSVELPSTAPTTPPTPPPPPVVAEENLGKPKVSVSVNTGLSSLAHGTAAGLRSENNNLLVKLKLNKLVQNNLVASNTPVQINQNGWKKSSSEPNSKRNSSRGGNPSLELKLSSRCCTLC